jgi:hypothetical protein
MDIAWQKILSKRNSKMAIPDLWLKDSKKSRKEKPIHPFQARSNRPNELPRSRAARYQNEFLSY